MKTFSTVPERMSASPSKAMTSTSSAVTTPSSGPPAPSIAPPVPAQHRRDGRNVDITPLVDAVIRHIHGDHLALPLLPEGTRRVLRATTGDEPDLRAVAEAVGRDAAMTAHVLRLANSALYRGRDTIVALSQAVSRLGARRVREVALVAAAETQAFRLGGFQDWMKRERRLSLARALYAAEIARVLKASVDEAFLVALLADIGMPVILQGAVDVVGARSRELSEDESLRAALWAVAVEHHARVGARVCRAWGFSQGLAAAIEHHHDEHPPAAASCVVWTTVLATMLADADADHAREAPLIVEELAAARAAGELNLYPEDLERVLAKRPAIQAAIAELS